MSQQLISRSSDLKRLRDEGYDIEVRAGHLLVKQVPYVSSNKEVRRGILISQLDVDGSVTAKPTTHVALFAGEHPCDQHGAKISRIEHASNKTRIDQDLVADHSFSSKPREGYVDYYDKMTTYARIIYSPAQAIDPTVTPIVFPAIAASPEDVFHYVDTASSRAGITAATLRLELPKIAIVGVGGTGSYVLDLVSKTPVKEIHIYDGDKFSNHNAFRSPRAASLEELDAKPQKVAYFAAHYSRMHRHVIPHDYYISESNVGELMDMAFVFLCLDKGGAKQLIVEGLEARGIPFIDVGMGVELDDNHALGGVLRVTTSTPRMRDHVRSKGRISFGDTNGNNDYDRNIQIADLNALNAALAVVKWKKLFGFYRDLEDEHFTAYTIDGNHVINEDMP